MAASLGLVAGLLIGAVGVGGIILVPCLLLLPIAAREEECLGVAISSCMFSYIFVGLAVGAAYARRDYVVWGSVAWLLVGAVPGAAGGALLLTWLRPVWVEMAVHCLVVLSGGHSLYRSVRGCVRRRPGEGVEGKEAPYDVMEVPQKGEVKVELAEVKEVHKEAMELPVKGDKAPEEVTEAPEEGMEAVKSEIKDRIILDHTAWQGRVFRTVLGLVVGAGSALTGTGGPVVLLPLLLPLDWPTLDALALAQLLQLPLALGAVTSLLVQGTLPCWQLGGSLAAGLVPGALVGAAVAHRLPGTKLRGVVAVVLVLCGVGSLGRLVFTHLL